MTCSCRPSLDTSSRVPSSQYSIKIYISSCTSERGTMRNESTEETSRPWHNKHTDLYPVQLHTKVADKVGMFNSFKNLQLIRRFLYGLVVIGLKANLEANSVTVIKLLSVLIHIWNEYTVSSTYLLHGHQFTSVHIDARVNLPILPFACEQREKM